MTQNRRFCPSILARRCCGALFTEVCDQAQTTYVCILAVHVVSPAGLPHASIGPVESEFMFKLTLAACPVQVPSIPDPFVMMTRYEKGARHLVSYPPTPSGALTRDSDASSGGWVRDKVASHPQKAGQRIGARTGGDSKAAILPLGSW